MAVANTKSTIVTNGDATPPALTKSHIHGGVIRESVGYVEVAAADDDNSVYRFARLPSNARLSQLLVKNDGITGGTDYNWGLHHTADDGGAAEDDNCIADAIDMSSARAVYTDISEIAEEDGEKMLWELAGQSSDPQVEYDLTCTGITVGTGAGTIAVLIRYVL